MSHNSVIRGVSAMTTIKQLALTFFLICLCALLMSAQAQTPRMTTINITPETDKVRISAVGDVSEMRVEVSDEQGEVVFQSGQITGQRLDWQMTDSQGERVAAGAYLVTVTFRTAAGKLRKRVEQVTVDEAEKPNTQTAGTPQAAQATVTTSNPGVFGTIARFTGESTIANSIITQTTTGKIGISAADPQAKLEVAGNWTGEDGALRLSGDKPTIRLTGGPIVNNQSWIMHLGSNGPGNFEFYRRAGQAWGQVMSLTPAGKVGIGTTAPAAKLQVQGSGIVESRVSSTDERAVLSLHGLGRIWTMESGVTGLPGMFGIYDGTAGQVRLAIDPSGNVIIGRSKPHSGVRFEVLSASGATILAAYDDSPSDEINNLVYVKQLQLGHLEDVGSKQLCVSNFGGRVGWCSSSLRYKTAVRPFTTGLEFINRLRPISFVWRSDGTPDLGLGAEEVAEVEPRLVTHNEQGQIEGVKYDQLNVVLINAVKEQQAQIQQQQKLIDRLQAQLNQVKRAIKKKRSSKKR
jgi:hypothetical protein